MDSATPVGQLLRRGLTLRCPSCGARGIVERWLHLAERCPACGLRLEREEGAFLGSWFLNICVTQAVLSGWILLAFAVTLPDPPLGDIVAVAALIVVAVPLVIFPFTKTTWAALHLALGPLEPEEEADRAVFRFERGDADEDAEK